MKAASQDAALELGDLTSTSWQKVINEAINSMHPLSAQSVLTLLCSDQYYYNYYSRTIN